MSERSWSVEDYMGFLGHKDPGVRHWAADRLRAQHPDVAPEAMVACLDDSDRGIALLAARTLVDAADPRFAAPTLARFERSEGLLAGLLASALGAMGVAEAAPAMVARLGRPALAAESLKGISEGLGALGIGSALRAALERGGRNPDGTGMLCAGIVEGGEPADIRWMVERMWSEFSPEQRATCAALIAERFGVGDLVHELRWALQTGVPEAAAAAEAWISKQVPLTDGRLHSMVPAWWDGAAEWMGTVAHEARALAVDVGAAPEDNRWPEGWRGRGWRALSLLDALAATAPEEAPEESLTDLSLALLCAAAVGRDDAAALAAAASAASDDDTGDGEASYAAAAMALLRSRRRDVEPAVTAAVVAAGPAALVALLETLEDDGNYWGGVRAARAIAAIARAHPGACDEAVTALFEAIRRDGVDTLAEASMWALVAIGEPALPPIRDSLLEGTDGEQGMIEALGEIPVPSSAQTLLDYAAAVGFMDEMVVAALNDTGSAAAIGPMAAIWSPGEIELAETLLLLTALNDVEHPDGERWRTDRNEKRRQQRRWSRELGAMMEERRAVDDRGAPTPPADEGAEAETTSAPSPEDRRKKRKEKSQARRRRRKKTGRR